MSINTKTCAACGARCPYNAARCPGCGAGFVLLSPLETRRSVHPAASALLVAASAIALAGALVYMSLGERHTKSFDRERLPARLSAAIPRVSSRGL